MEGQRVEDAAITGDLDSLRAGLVYQNGAKRKEALILSAAHGHAHCVEWLLLEAGDGTWAGVPPSLVDAVDGGGYTPLAWALRKRHAEVVKVLRRAGASLNRVHKAILSVELYERRHQCRLAVVALLGCQRRSSLLQRYVNRDVVLLLVRNYVWPTKTFDAWGF